MQVEFETEVKNGTIAVPNEYIPKISKKVKVIVISKVRTKPLKIETNPLQLLNDIQEEVINSPLKSMSLEEINCEISEYRKENRL